MTYGPVVAEAYDSYLAGDDLQDEALYRDLIAESQAPALELGCGTGRLLLPLLAGGFAVEGLDRSSDMLAVCRRKAAVLGLDPVLHQADMTDFELQNRYGLAFCAVGSLMLLAEPGAMEAALASVRRHLLPGGRLAVSLEQPGPPRAVGERWLRRDVVRGSDGVRFRAWGEALPPRWPGVESSLSVNERLSPDGEVVEQERDAFHLRPMRPDGFSTLLSAAGFRDIRLLGPRGEAKARDDGSYVAVARAGEG